jgi:hypothetical protein
MNGVGVQLETTGNKSSHTVLIWNGCLSFSQQFAKKRWISISAKINSELKLSFSFSFGLI